MRKIKQLNGYSIYQLTARDAKNGEAYLPEYICNEINDIFSEIFNC